MIQRHTPLGRSPVRRKPARRIARQTAEDKAHLDWVHSRPCAAGAGGAHWGPCKGVIEAHHAGVKPGMAMKCSDMETVALCSYHHRTLTDGSGPFKDLKKAAKRLLNRMWLEMTNLAYLRHTGGTP